MLLITRTSRDPENEQGTALLAALGLTAVAAVIAIVVTTTSVFSVGYTTSTQAAVQAQAAAEAGIDFAAAGVSSTTAACQPSYSNPPSAPKFTVAVSYSAISPVPSPLPPAAGLNWVSGCPTLSATLVRFVSTGTASSLGLVGNSGGNTRKVEAIYPFNPTSFGTGAALYSYSQTDNTGTNFTLNQGAGAPPASIQYLTAPGGLACTSANNNIHGSLVVGSGSVTVGPGCTIDGDLSAGGDISVAGLVKGNVTSAASSSPAISVTGAVNGYVFAGGPMSIRGPVGGNVTAGPATGITSISATVGGTVTVSGTVTVANASPPLVRSGIITQNASVVGPIPPFVPGWVDYAYSLPDSQKWTGSPLLYNENVLPATSCSSAGLVNDAMSAALALGASGQPQIFNALSCGAAGPNFGNLPSTVTLTSNLVIVAKSINFPASGNSFVSTLPTPTSPHKDLWLIIPDNGPTTDQPDCARGSSISVGKVTISASGNVDAMIYSPCAITNSPASWQGQIYSSSFKMSSGFEITYVPLGLPGYDLGKGPGSPGTAVGLIGTRISIRNTL
jgi:cytoskeletal protein CcmA (bactofilin family)